MADRHKTCPDCGYNESRLIEPTRWQRIQNWVLPTTPRQCLRCHLSWVSRQPDFASPMRWVRWLLIAALGFVAVSAVQRSDEGWPFLPIQQRIAKWFDPESASDPVSVASLGRLEGADSPRLSESNASPTLARPIIAASEREPDAALAHTPLSPSTRVIVRDLTLSDAVLESKARSLGLDQSFDDLAEANVRMLQQIEREQQHSASLERALNDIVERSELGDGARAQPEQIPSLVADRIKLYQDRFVQLRNEYEDSQRSYLRSLEALSLIADAYGIVDDPLDAEGSVAALIDSVRERNQLLSQTRDELELAQQRLGEAERRVEQIIAAKQDESSAAVAVLKEQVDARDQQISELNQRVERLAAAMQGINSGGSEVAATNARLADRINALPAGSDPSSASPITESEAVSTAVQGSADGEPVRATEVQRAEIEVVIEQWRTHWVDQDVENYLARYSNDFRPDDGRSRSAWVDKRSGALTRPSAIAVLVSDLEFLPTSEGRATARFRQLYQSSNYSDEVVKELKFQREQSGWKIIGERELEVLSQG
ncbi:hypothetical protein OAS86_02630 [Gammaproteobacteria bacterium]|nr:hypothetical protein [Gammaproteobacteria bacterium]